MRKITNGILYVGDSDLCQNDCAFDTPTPTPIVSLSTTSIQYSHSNHQLNLREG